MIRSLLTRAALFTLVLFYFTPTIRAVDWTMYQKDSTRNGIVPEDSVTGDLELRWSRRSELQYYQMPVYQNGVFYFLEYSTVGNISWTVYAVSKSGQELWRTSGLGNIKSDFTVGENLVLIPSDKLVALNAANGQKLWEASSPNSYLGYPLVSDGLVFTQRKYVNGGYFGVMALNADDGGTVWFNNKSEYFATGISKYNDSIIIKTGTYNSNSTGVYSFNMATGSLNWQYMRSYNPAGPLVVDESRGYGFTMGTTGMLTQIDLSTGAKVAESKQGSSPTSPILFDGKACYITSSASWVAAASYLNCYGYASGTGESRALIQKGIRLSESWSRNVILVGDRIYISTATGELASFKLDASDYRTTALVDEQLGGMIYADGTFLIRNNARNTLYAVSDKPIQIIANPNPVLVSPYKTDGEYHEYLGQTHSHYVPDIIPKNTEPSDTVQKYKDAGYDFIALTEHNELSGNPNVEGITYIEYAGEDTQDRKGNHILDIGISNPIIETEVSNVWDEKIIIDQDRINRSYNQGGFTILAHPNSATYPWKVSQMIINDRYNATEIYNTGIKAGGRYLEVFRDINPWDNAYALDKWDSVLSARKFIYATAGDDYTPRNPGFDGAAIVVLAQSNTQDEILSSLKFGNFYALQGSQAPRIKVNTNGSAITVTSNQQGTIKFIGKGGKVLKQESNVLVSSYGAKGDEVYIRAEVTANKKTSWSQPISVVDNRAAASFIAGSFKFDLDQGQLESNNTSGVQASTLSTNQYPNQSPPYGYVSPVYSFNSDGQVLNGTELTISYVSQALLTNEDNLSIYTYDEPTSTWQKVASTIDKAAKTVKVNLSHFSLYTLSAETQEDSENPTVSLLEPTDLSNLEGNINLTINAQDNNAVFRVMTMIDDKFISSDSDPLDGWSATFNTNDLANGNHMLTLIAEDPAGNTGEAEYQFSIDSSTFIPPTITIITPTQNTQVNNQSQITGTFASQNPIESIGIFLDDYYLKDATITENTYDQIIDWSEIKEGSHTLKAVLVDEKGNTAIAERNITVGIKVSYDDTREMIRLFLEQGKIKNKGISEALLANLSVMEKWDKLGNMALVEKHYRHVVSFIDQQVNLPKPHIDGAAGNTLKEFLSYLLNQR